MRVSNILFRLTFSLMVVVSLYGCERGSDTLDGNGNYSFDFTIDGVNIQWQGSKSELETSVVGCTFTDARGISGGAQAYTLLFRKQIDQNGSHFPQITIALPTANIGTYQMNNSMYDPKNSLIVLFVNQEIGHSGSGTYMGIPIGCTVNIESIGNINGEVKGTVNGTLLKTTNLGTNPRVIPISGRFTAWRQN